MLTAAAPLAPTAAVTVRMYKGLLGDCFLLRLRSGGETSSILVDCGVLQGVPGAGDRMRRVAADIVAATGGRLDLVIATHEHFDHLSGFGYAPDVFFGGGLKIGAAWMGWTESPDDPQAQALRARFDKGRTAVAAAAARAATMAGQGVAGAAEVTAGLENFIGPVIEPSEPAAAAPAARGPAPKTTRAILEALKATAGQVAYLEPGRVLRTPGALGLRAYVLGPPRSEARLFKSLPSPGDAKETYLGGDGLSLADHLLAVLDPTGADTPSDGAEAPFPSRYGHKLPPAAPAPVPAPASGSPVAAAPPDPPRPARGAAEAWMGRVYGATDAAWRRIDADWLQGAGALALKLDSNTNNTSLALAFETADGDVLLFAADAQVGNWLSWSDQPYPDPDAPAAAAPATLADLLPRVVLYKVGHHASHNATLDKQGLELMTHPALAAFIPLVEADARRQPGGGWAMPFPALLARLLSRTQGRVMRGDCTAGRDLDGRPTTTDADFLSRAVDSPDGLYVEYALAAPAQAPA